MRRRLRPLPTLCLCLLFAGPGCTRSGQPTPSATESAPASAAASGAPATAPPGAEPVALPTAPPTVALAEATPAAPKDAEATRVFIDGVDQTATHPASELSGRGFTRISLRDDWTPFIFDEFKDTDGNILPNRYRPIYIGLANNRTDGDGRELKPGANNYLELFGLPPAIGLVRARLMADEEKACLKDVDYAVIAGVDRVPLRKASEQRSAAAAVARTRKKLEEQRVKSGAATLEALVAARPDLKDEWAYIDRTEREAKALVEIVKRLECDGHVKAGARYKTELEDPLFKDALLSFQMRHMIYEYPGLRPKTLEMLSKPPLTSNFLQFSRALRERVADAAGILEDGTATADGEAVTWTNAAGQVLPVRNLVVEFNEAALKQLGVETPEKLLAFFKAHPAEDFKHLEVALRLPAKPEYYSEHMEFDVVVDRGDVWYQPTWDEAGVWRYPSRERMPRFHVAITHGEQRFNLVRWPTTIGGWRAEQAANGYEYYRYKGSDVGRRVIRKINSGPTWVAPPSTPIRGLVKNAEVNGHRERIVNYDEMGPGYLSAYGLVAGYFVSPGEEGRPDWDNGIRAHGSSDYMSITNASKFSHGCHRLMNHLAVRLYDFLLQHRKHTVMGDQPMSSSRQMYKDGAVYEIRLASRGFEFQMNPPVPVNVLSGRIRGNLSHPFEGYLPKPGQVYPPGPVPNPKGGVEP